MYENVSLSVASEIARTAGLSIISRDQTLAASL